MYSVGFHPYHLMEFAWGLGSSQIKISSSAKEREKFISDRTENCGKGTSLEKFEILVSIRLTWGA